MYLNGQTTISEYGKNKRPIEDGFEIKGHLFEFGCLGDMLSLHEYIRDHFGNGFDDQHICLDWADIEQIVKAIKNNELEDDFDEDDMEPFNKAIKWLEKSHVGILKTIIYEASW